MPGLVRNGVSRLHIKKITLDDALGNMYMDAESEYNPDFEMPGGDTGDNDDDDYIPW